MRRLWIGLIALLVAGATYGTWSALSGGSGSTSASPRTYRDPEFGWTIVYPSGMQLGHFRSGGFFESDGIRLTNFQPDLGISSSGEPAMGWLKAFPAHGVALQIWFGQRIPGPPPVHDSSFPITLSSLRPIQTYVGVSEPIPLYRTFSGDGTSFAAAAWFGPKATRANRTMVAQVLRSMRFPTLATGTLWRDWYYVLGSARDHPVGSVSLIPASQLPVPRGFHESEPVYLVHAPRGFYVVRAKAEDPACPVRFDRSRFVFSCPSLGLTWDRIGHLQATAPETSAQDIGPHPVAVTVHGQILYCPFFGSIAPTDLWN